MALSAPGVGSNLDVNSIVTQLMSIERQPLEALDTKEVGFQGKLSAYGTLRGALSAFQTAASDLSSLAKFQAFSATSSDTGILSASASATASAGSYAVEVTQLAKAQAVVTAGQANATASIGSGAATTLTFQFGTISGGTLTNGVYTGAGFDQAGTSSTGTVTIDATNNSLQGIRDAINSADIGVKASIVKDGSASPYRLVLQSEQSGAANSIKLSVSGDATLASLLSYDAAGTQQLTQTTAAQDAKATVNGVAISNSTNVFADAIDGVSLTVTKAGTTQLSVAQDTAGVKNSVGAFVKAYNDLNKTLEDLTSFDPTTKRAGVLIGEATVRTVQNQLRNVLSGTLAGLNPGGVQVLSQAGVTFQRDGTLALDSSKLSQALAQDPKGTAALFASFGRPSDSLISFSSAESNTGAGRYAVTISQLATQGTLVGSGAAGLTITAGVNDQLTVNVDGVGATVSLTAGTYTATSLAAQVQAAVNGAAAFSTDGISVTATQNAGVLTLTSKRFGSASAVTAGGNAATGLFGATPTNTAGLDVAGTIGGAPATGSGQKLTAGPGSGAQGLILDITGGALGVRGSVDFSHGYARKVDDILDSLLGTGGTLQGRTDGLTRSIKDLDKQRETLSLRMTAVEARYRAQFTALDSLVASMQSTSNFLTQQLAQLAKL